MNKKYLAALALLAVTLTSCGTKTAQPPTSSEAPPDVSQPAVSQPQGPTVPTGPEELTTTWELLNADGYMSGLDWEDPFRTVEVPDYNGMDRDAFYDWALEQGFNSDVGPYPLWAEDGQFSPSHRYVAYRSNRDCIDPPSDTGCSIFLLDVASGENQVLLSGSDGTGYSVITWLDEETMLCINDKEEYFLCGVDGSAVKADGLFESEWGHHFGTPNGFLFAEAVEKELRLVQANRDGTVTELARAPFEGEDVTCLAISDGGHYVCYILRKDMMSFDRYVVIWNTATGEMTEIEPPQMSVGEDNTGMVEVNWAEDGAFEVAFAVADAPEPEGHHELWKLSSDAWEVRDTNL